MKDLAVLGFLIFWIGLWGIIVYSILKSKQQKLMSVIFSAIGLILYIIGMILK